MIQGEIERLLRADPFEPFRISLLSNAHYDIFNPDTVAAQHATVTIAGSDGNWVVFPYSSVASIESLFSDFHGELAARGA